MFYVYTLARPDNTVFYVGKGTSRRIYQHDSEARKGCTCHKCNVIRKIWKQGKQVLRYFVFTTENEEEAFTYERELIAQYGRDNLCNQTDGGEGVSGRKHTPEVRAKIKARWADPEFREKMRLVGKRPKSEETRRKMRLWRLGKRGFKHSEETRQKFRERRHSEETKQKMSEAHKLQTPRRGFTRSEVSKQKTSETLKALKGSHLEKRYPQRVYELIDPTGVCYTCTNLSQFCREHELKILNLNRVVLGKYKQTSGWTGRILEEVKKPKQ